MTAFDLQAYWTAETDEHKAVADKTIAALAGPFAQWLDAGVACIQGGGKILFFGNGGSATDAQHLATELTIRYIKDRPAIAARALTTDTSTLTAAGNDTGFENIFARQIEALGKPGDLAIGISTSGTSPNILRALETAREKGLKTVGMTGTREKGKAEMGKRCDIVLAVPSEITARMQEMHILLGHIFCGALERQLGLSA